MIKLDYTVVIKFSFLCVILPHSCWLCESTFFRERHSGWLTFSKETYSRLDVKDAEVFELYDKIFGLLTQKYSYANIEREKSDTEKDDITFILPNGKIELYITKEKDYLEYTTDITLFLCYSDKNNEDKYKDTLKQRKMQDL